jgi:DedD protein
MTDVDDDSNFRQRLWGAAVFIAVMVIVLPLLLDGAGSESQFRRVEKLRQEPPGIVDAQGRLDFQQIPQVKAEIRAVGADGIATSDPTEIPDNFKPDIKIGEDDPPDYMKAEKEVREALRQTRTTAPLTAWVVQAGSFTSQDNALAVRDRLRRGGFASFVRDRESENEPFRVLVGPMINEQSAVAARDRVVDLLGREAVVLTYP